MKLTLSWLKDHLETDASLTEIVERLTSIGLEVESVDDKASLKPFVIAKVLTAVQHPDADRLRVLTVDTGDGKPVQVVCGAPNARAGLVGAFAAPGTYVPGIDVTLSVGKIRGVESHGMMCSERELELSDEHDGIIDLPADAPVGTPYAAYAKLDDPLIEINLTPNRPDATSVYGIARDLAASGLGKLKDGTVAPVAGEGDCPVKVTIEALGALPRLCVASGQGREERTIAEMDAAAADRHRPAPHQCAGRHHQLRHLRPRTPAACVRREEGRREFGRPAWPRG